MENVKFFLWAGDLALGEDGNTKRSEFLTKASRLVENDINDAGGIGGKDAVINFARFPAGQEGLDCLVAELKKDPDIAFTIGASTAYALNQFKEKIDLDSQITFFLGPRVEHQNNFEVAHSSRTAKVTAVKDILLEGRQDDRVFFIHDGRRVAAYEDDIFGSHRGELRSINFAEYQDPDQIAEKLDPILTEINDQDVLVLDVGLRVFRRIFDYLNENKKIPLVIKLFGSIDGRFPKIDFPIIELSGSNFFSYLDFEDIIRRCGISVTDTEKMFLKEACWRLEIPLLISYAARRSGCTANEKISFLSEMRDALNSIDGKRDIFIGKQLSFAFNNNVNQIETNYAYQFPKSLQRPWSYPKIFYHHQYLPRDGDDEKVKVNYLYIDILRITNIDIGDGTWSGEFYLDIVSVHDDPIDIIKFNNLSSINPKFEVRKMWERVQNGDGGKTSRYYVVANFDFTPEADNYPFDWQHIFVSYSITDRSRFGIIQPTPEALLDKEFHIHGWKLQEANSGILRRKSTIYEGSTLEASLDVREESRVGWMLSRANSVTILKIGIPLFFLIFLVYYTLFAPFAGESGSFGILTTAFLSGIALYFSTERPQPLRMTTIDLIFIYFYILTGGTIILTAAGFALGQEVYEIIMLCLKVFVPIGVAAFVGFLWKRIRLSSSKISVNR